MVKWYSLFSHTGRETAELEEALSEYVSLEKAITTNLNYSGNLQCLKLGSYEEVNTWLVQTGDVQPNSIITLNGYMGILPKAVLDYLHSIGCKVFNVHPAPIQLYPELRGKDPQERLYEGVQSGKYTKIGVVIHEVDAGVDTGRIRHWRIEIADPAMARLEMYQYLHMMAVDMWTEFIPEVVRFG